MKINFKWITVFFATLLLGLTACNKNQEGPNNSTLNGEKAWTAFTISLPSTRAESDVENGAQGDTYTGSADEQKISTVRVALYNGGVVAHVFDYTVTNNTFAPAGGNGFVAGSNNTSFTTEAKLIEKAEYEVYVFINAPVAVNEATGVGKNLLALNTAADFDMSKVVTTNGVYMSNAKGGIETKEANWGKTKEEAEQGTKPVALNVDRAVAKVFVKSGKVDKVSPEGATAEVRRFALDVTNKKLFWVRQMDKKLGGTEAEELTTLRVESYAKDPNMGNNYTTAKPTDLVAEFNYKDNGSIFDAYPGSPSYKPTSGYNVPGWNDDNGLYVAENTMDAAQQYEVATTRALLEVIYTPSEIQSESDKSFVEYMGIFMTPEQFQQKVTAAKQADATDASVQMPAGFVKEVKDKTYDTAAKSFVDGNVKFYKDGVNYYYVLIRHFDDTQEPATMAYGRYGVVRNNIYKITINSIKGPGEPVIDQPDPETPDDKEKAWIAAKVEVNPWLIRSYSYDI